jgi:hypothetical protein
MWTILSGLFGGLLRLAPELFKFLDAKNERKHELDMQDKALEFQRLKGDQRVDEIGAQGAADWNKGAIDALKTAIEGQDKPSGIPWIDGLSKLMRPLITLQWVVLLYPGVIITTFVLLIHNNVPIIDALNKVFGPEEKALVSFIVDFWFVGRVLEGGRKLASK